MGRGVKLPKITKEALRGKTHGDIFGGAPTPIMPTENIGIMSGAIRKKRGDSRRDERGSSPNVQLGRVTQPDGSTLITYGSSPRRKERGGSIGRRRGFPAIRPDGKGIKEPPAGMKYDEADRLVPSETQGIDASGIAVDPVTGKIVAPSKVISLRPRFDPRRPSAVQETRRVNVQDPTLGGPPEREVPIPRERRPRITRESDPRGPAPFAPDDNAAKDRFFETMFERAANQKERRAIDKGERRDRQEAMRDEARMRDSEMGGNRRRRRDFTRRRPEKRRSREERAAFRDRYVSTLGGNFFS